MLGARLAATRTTRLIQRKAPFSGTTVSDLVPETHQRSFGQPTVYSHPYLMKKEEGSDIAFVDKETIRLNACTIFR